VVEQTTIVDHELSACVSRVADSPAACRRLLRALRDPAALADLAEELRWAPVRDELSTLLAHLDRHRQGSRPSRWL
jgi:hypothetical protein